MAMSHRGQTTVSAGLVSAWYARAVIPAMNDSVVLRSSEEGAENSRMMRRQPGIYYTVLYRAGLFVQQFAVIGASVLFGGIAMLLLFVVEAGLSADQRIDPVAGIDQRHDRGAPKGVTEAAGKLQKSGIISYCRDHISVSNCLGKSPALPEYSVRFDLYGSQCLSADLSIEWHD
jgi:hypothetical protein